MGKVKRGRQKAHNAAVKIKSGAKDDNNDVNMEDNQGSVLTEMKPPDVGNNLFAGLDLKKYNLKQNLPDFDTKSTITSKSLRELRMKKKDKLKLRQDLFKQKLNAIEAAKKNAKEKKRKQQTPVVGDIGALGDVLPTLDLLLKTSTHPKGHREESKKVRGIAKEKNRKKQIQDDMSIFRQVIAHPSFKDNPTATISEHLQNRQIQEDMDS